MSGRGRMSGVLWMGSPSDSEPRCGARESAPLSPLARRRAPHKTAPRCSGRLSSVHSLRGRGAERGATEGDQRSRPQSRGCPRFKAGSNLTQERRSISASANAISTKALRFFELLIRAKARFKATPSFKKSARSFSKSTSGASDNANFMSTWSLTEKKYCGGASSIWPIASSSFASTRKAPNSYFFSTSNSMPKHLLN